MSIYEVLTICLINLISFIVGAKIGQNISKGKEIKINPIEIIKDKKEEIDIKKSESLEQRQISTMFENIDKYDGTSLGQQEIPKE